MQMAKVLQLLSSFRLFLEFILQKCFNTRQTLFWRKEHNMLDKAIAQKLFNLVFLMTELNKMVCMIRVLHEPITVHCRRQGGLYRRGRFLGKTMAVKPLRPSTVHTVHEVHIYLCQGITLLMVFFLPRS